MTTTPSSLERARKWLMANHEAWEWFYHSYRERMIESLALEFDRVRLEGREKESFQCMALFRGARKANDVYLLIHDRVRDHKAQLAALNQPAGEKEG